MSGLGAISGLGSISGLGVIERRPAKVEVRCDCGKRYRVAAQKAGRSFRCKACSTRLRIPAQPESLSSHDAQLILAELGIDASARERYEEQVLCFYCTSPLGKSERECLDEGEQPVCFGCRASAANAAVEQREDAAQRPANYKELDRWVRTRPVAEARKRAVGLATLVWVGITGLSTSVFGLGIVASLLIGAAVAAFGGRHTYQVSLNG